VLLKLRHRNFEAPFANLDLLGLDGRTASRKPVGFGDPICHRQTKQSGDRDTLTALLAETWLSGEVLHKHRAGKSLLTDFRGQSVVAVGPRRSMKCPCHDG